MASLSNKAGMLVVANLLKYGVGFILPMLLVRLLTPQEYGTYRQLTLVTSIVSALLLLGLPLSIYYFDAHDKPARRTALQVQTSVMLGLLGILGALVLLVGQKAISAMVHNPAIAGLIPAVAASSALMMGSEGFIAFLIVADRYRLALSFEVVETIVRVALMVVPLMLGYGLPGLVLSLLAYAVLRYGARLVTLYVSRSRDAAGWRRSLFPREQLRYSLPLAATSWVGIGAGMLDRTIIALFFSTVDYAIYSVGALEIPLDVIFQASVANVLRATLPRLIREGNELEIRRLLRESVRKLALIVLPSFVFLWSFAQEFITVLFTHRYEQSVHVFRIYLLLLPPYMFVLSAVPQAYGETRINFRIASIGSATHAVLSFVLLKLIGFYGPAISGVACSYLSAALYVPANLRLTRSRLHDLVPFAALLRTMLACVCAAVVSRSVGHPFASDLVGLVASGLVFSTAYLVAALVFGVLTKSDQRLLWQTMTRVFARARTS